MNKIMVNCQQMLHRIIFLLSGTMTVADLMFISASAGGVQITNYDSVGNAGVATFDVADSASSSSVEPVSLQEDSGYNFIC